MYLKMLFIENFRIFGSEGDGKHLRLCLKPGLNVLAGENDSGKTAILDALRHVLWTTSLEFHRVTEDDFHVEAASRATTLTITCSFADLSVVDRSRFLEWLSIDDAGNPQLCITLQATRVVADGSGANGSRRIACNWRSGRAADGPSIEGDMRDFLRITYLRALRDAEAELAAGRGSRLAQILESHPDFGGQADNDFDPGAGDKEPTTLVGIMRQAEHRIANNPVVTAAKERLNDQYLQHLSLGSDNLTGDIGVSRSTELRQILEKLELWLSPPSNAQLRVQRGLGFNNILFMATELLLLGDGKNDSLPLLLIEEPEAHIHPQMQLRLMSFLDEKSRSGSGVQILLTTHSPNLASKAALQDIVLVNRGEAFPLREEATKLDSADYRFLQRFLDVTRSNLFFARGVMIVEGDAENLLIPFLADKLGKSFSTHGVSTVNVGSRGLFRYARIFQRRDDKVLPVRVACLADRDLPSASASTYVPQRKTRTKEAIPTFDNEFTPAQCMDHVARIKSRDGGSVRTFVSPQWTLEYDLALTALGLYVHIAVQLAKASHGKSDVLSPGAALVAICLATKTWRGWQRSWMTAADIAAKVYEPLFAKRASKAETAQFLVEILEALPLTPSQYRRLLPQYIVEAIDYLTE